MHGAGPALPHVWRLRRRCRRRMVPEVRRRWRGRPLGSHRIEAANMARSAPFNGLGCLAAGQRLMPQHEQLHLLGGSGAAQQQDQPKHLPGDHLSQPQRHPGDRAGCRSTAIRCWRACVTFWNPTGLAPLRATRPTCLRPHGAALVTCRDIPVRAGRLVEPTRAWCLERDCFRGLGAIAGRESRCARAS